MSLAKASSTAHDRTRYITAKNEYNQKFRIVRILVKPAVFVCYIFIYLNLHILNQVGNRKKSRIMGFFWCIFPVDFNAYSRLGKLKKRV